MIQGQHATVHFDKRQNRSLRYTPSVAINSMGDIDLNQILDVEYSTKDNIKINDNIRQEIITYETKKFKIRKIIHSYHHLGYHIDIYVTEL